jgi:hypothetical protein
MIRTALIALTAFLVSTTGIGSTAILAAPTATAASIA